MFFSFNNCEESGEDGSTILAVFRKFAKIAVDVIWPVRCPVCGAIGEMICPTCVGALVLGSVVVCMECGESMPCGKHLDCQTIRGVARYDPASREVIHAMKYRGARAIASILGERIARELSRPIADVLVPIPLHRSSDRGYNQAELIARAAGRVWGMPVVDALVWRTDVGSQARKSGKGSRILPKDAIMCRKDIGSLGRVCIVDDVATTGSTIRAARDALEECGVHTVGAVVWSVS